MNLDNESISILYQDSISSPLETGDSYPPSLPARGLVPEPDFKAYCVYMSNSLYIEAFMEYREFVDSHSKNEGTDLFCTRRVEKRSVHRPLLDPTGGKEVCS